MGTLAAISVDSLGNRSQALAGIPPLRRDPGTPADRERALRWVTFADRDPPGQSMSDVWQQANSFTSGVYIAVNTIMTAMGGATVVVSQRRNGTVRKSASATGSGESEWHPLDPEHEIARLFADPNGVQTTGDFIAEYELCRSLFGTGIIYTPMGRDDKPAQLWNLRKNYITTFGGVSIDYPSGRILYTTPQPSLWGVGGAGAALPIPREHIVLHRRPHPRFPWDGYSALEGGAKLVDFLNGVVDSRQMAMDRGLSLDAIVSMAGASDDQLQQADARIRERYTGSNRGQRFMTIDGERVSVNMLGTTPDKMSYHESYSDGVRAVLALFGVPAVCAFLADADYSGFFAAARAWREGNLAAEAKSIGDTLTRHLIRPYWGPDYKVELKLPPLMDPEQGEREIATLLQAKAITRNEVRAKMDMGPLPDGDMTPDEYAAQLQKKSQPEQPGMGGGGEQDPIAALLGGQDPTAEHAAPGDVEGPDVGAASEGSLPGAVAKAIKFSKPENYDKVRDLPEGRELWVGQNDWESGTTWGWVMDPRTAQGPIAYINVSHDDCPGCGGNLEADYTGDAKACNAFARKKVDAWLKGLKKGESDAVRKAVNLRVYFARLVEEVCA